MAGAAKLYGRYLGIALRSQMQYRASMLMQIASRLLIAGIEMAGIWVLFDRFERLRSWSLAEVALFYGLITTAFGLAGMIGRGFDAFSRQIVSGDFDRVLLRPRSAALQVSGSELGALQMGRSLQGLVVLIWAAAALDVNWTAGRLGLTAFTLVGGTCLFYGLFVLQATMSFWTIQTLEIANIVTDGGRETGQFPLSIYRPWFRKVFTFVVPLACVTYFPGLAILDRDDPLLASPIWFHWSAPLIGVLFLIASLQVWRIGVRHYRSTGS
ncbi:MAG: ABC transporter permease [Planctomycetota bacterium]|jgi:ABC-2 type transport system permease protein